MVVTCERACIKEQSAPDSGRARERAALSVCAEGRQETIRIVVQVAGMKRSRGHGGEDDRVRVSVTEDGPARVDRGEPWICHDLFDAIALEWVRT